MVTTGYQVGDSDIRPWGSWEILAVDAGYAVKRIIVQPGARISLQRHAHRTEHWVIVGGAARVTRGSDVFDLASGGTTMIEAGTMHRIENTGSGDMVFIEVAVGAVLDEADIERFADDYGRA